MKQYEIKTRVYMKPYNEKKWFITNDLVSNMIIECDNVISALNEYFDRLENEYAIEISKNARKNKEPLYDKNDNQAGYIFTGKTGFEDRHYNVPYTEEYIDVFTRIYEIVNAF